MFNVTDIVDSCECDSLFAFQMEFFSWVFLLLKRRHTKPDDMIVKLDGIDDHRSVICTNDVIEIGIIGMPRHGV